VKNILKQYQEEYGSIEPYIVTKMEISILLALVITLFATIIQPWIILLNIGTAAVMVHSLHQVNKNYPEKTAKYTGILGTIYALAVASPAVLTRVTMKMSPMGTQIVMGALILLVATSLSIRTFISKKGVKAEVLVADGEDAIIRPEYDFLSGVKPKKYAVKNTVKAKKGDRVKVKVSTSLFKPLQPTEIERIVKGGKK